MARLIRNGDVFTGDEEAEGLVELVIPEPYMTPPVETQGEPWGWTKGPPYPRGWREDGRYGSE